jgi:hypothetical protein
MLYRTRRRTDDNERLQWPLMHTAATIIIIRTPAYGRYRRKHEDPLQNRYNALFKFEDSITRNFGFVSELSMNTTT